VRPIVGPILTTIPLIIALVSMLLIPRIHHDIKIANYLLYHFERNENIVNFPFKGAFWYGLGIIFPILLIHPIEVTCAIIMVISVGDAFSTLIGKFHGKYKIGEKTIEGFIAFVISSFLGAAIFVNVYMAAIFALIGGLIELFLTIFDDNFLVPTVLTLIYLIFNGFLI